MQGEATEPQDGSTTSGNSMSNQKSAATSSLLVAASSSSATASQAQAQAHHDPNLILKLLTSDSSKCWSSLGHPRLYAREKEVNELLNCYEQSKQRSGSSSSSNTGICLITGVSGTGKTALARSIEPLIRQDGGYMISGKCDQIQNRTTVPYAPFAEALARFVDDLLESNTTGSGHKEDSKCEDETQRRRLAMQEHLQSAITMVTQDTDIAKKVLTDAIPAFVKLIPRSKSSHQSSTTAHSSKTSKRRGAAAASSTNSPVVLLCKLFRSFCSPEWPLVLLLDDLQWLDCTSLALFRALAVEQSTIPGLLLIGTCRGNEVSLHDPLSEILRSIEDDAVPITDIRLSNLSHAAVEDLLADLLHLSNDETTQVSQLIYRQTSGNIFFTLQLIRNLHDTQVLQYSEHNQQWKWDANAAATIGFLSGDLDCMSLVSAIVDSVVTEGGLAMDADGSSSVEFVLMVASCLGAKFEENHLRMACSNNINAGALVEALQLVEQKGIITRHDNSMGNSSRTRQPYHWVHDRFQQGVYDRIPKSSLAKFHVDVGLNLLRLMSNAELNWNPFVVVNQFCHTTIADLLPNKVECILVANLALQAGEKAALSSAFDTARVYYSLGMDVLGLCSRDGKLQPESQQHELFREHYELCVNLYNAAAEAEYCVGNLEGVDALVEMIVDNPHTLEEDKLRAYETQIASLGARQDLDGGLRLGLKVLSEMLGERFPCKPSFLNVATQVLKTKYILGRMSDSDILNIKPMRDYKKLAVSRITQLIYPSCVRLNPTLSVLMVTRSIAVTLKHGISTFSALNVSGFGMICCHPLGDIPFGNRLMEIGLKIMEERKLIDINSRLQLVNWGFTKSWQCSIKETMAPLKIAARDGLNCGDPEMACFNYYVYVTVAFLTGSSPLKQLELEFAELRQEFGLRRQNALLFYLKTSQQACQNLQDSSKVGTELTGDFFHEHKGLEEAEGLGDGCATTTVYIFKCFVAVYFNEPEKALVAAKSLRKCNIDGFTTILVYQADFLSGLAEVMAARASGKNTYWAGKSSIKQLEKYALHAPGNVVNKIYLIKAHQYALRGRQQKSTAMFELSIRHAKENGFLNEEALACEHAGLSYLEWGETSTALEHLERSRDVYESWGASAKVDQLSTIICESKNTKS